MFVILCRKSGHLVRMPTKTTPLRYATKEVVLATIYESKEEAQLAFRTYADITMSDDQDFFREDHSVIPIEDFCPEIPCRSSWTRVDIASVDSYLELQGVSDKKDKTRIRNKLTEAFNCFYYLGNKEFLDKLEIEIQNCSETSVSK